MPSLGSMYIYPILILLSLTGSFGYEYYNEFADIQQFPDGKVLLVFQHVRVIEPDVWKQATNGHFSLLPRSLGEAFIKYNVEEFQLVFTQGRWMYDKWGTLPVAAASGVTLSTVFRTGINVDKSWKGFTHALSGLFCASLNFMDDAATVPWTPRIDTSPWNNTRQSRSRYSALPREAVCTENLTPWAKLLPCQTKAGIATLYNSYKVYDANYHSLSTSIAPKCLNEECRNPDMIFTQSLTVVLDPVRIRNSKDWLFSNLLDRKLWRSCPVANSSLVRLKTAQGDDYELAEEASVKTLISGSCVYEYDFSSRLNLDVGIQWNDAIIDYVTTANSSPINIRRYATGFGQERGGFHVAIRNQHPTESFEITYYEYVPWFLKVYLHTYHVHNSLHPGVLKNLSVQPTIGRKRPTILQALLHLPPNSLTEMSFEFDMAFMKYTEHPPDANRGFDVAPAIAIITTMNSSGSTTYTRMFTDPLLVSLPTPDFSMPYNVITMTCTLVALFFGSTFNMLTRNFTPLSVK
ncbi:hypothetical protein SmJEL517_g00057 [Synchytrium microbalum]|uniref:GPI transamidase component PIG-T n=1 Tax=Synchytrium microbalum TaxID=1806994 RepID=A0A507CGD3_9FUNG|nr:uncharacterized protein SmJEL517_g00057 [Synchytrium microbalum]TPX38269.1 hypothetical protein SmJEL517_g00057 [Synchytrium microbalum]